MLKVNEKSIAEYQLKYKRVYDMRSNSNIHMFREGFHVQYINNQVAVSKGGKMDHQWLPPDDYCIIQSINHNTLHVSLVKRNGKLIKNTYHVNKLRLWNDDGKGKESDPLLTSLIDSVEELSTLEMPSVDDDIISDKECEIDKIKDGTFYS